MYNAIAKLEKEEGDDTGNRARGARENKREKARPPDHTGFLTFGDGIVELEANAVLGSILQMLFTLSIFVFLVCARGPFLNICLFLLFSSLFFGLTSMCLFVRTPCWFLGSLNSFCDTIVSFLFFF